MHFSTWLIVAVQLLLWCCPASAGGPYYGDPLDLPGATSAADPHVIYVDGVYYLYPTTTAVSVECWSSTDLESWTYEGEVWGPAPEGAWNDADVWAPDVFRFEDLYFMYYTANNKIGVAVAESPTGPFEDVYEKPFIGGLHGETILYSIDAHVFQDDDGELYIYTTTYLPFSCLRVCRMSDPVTLAGEWTVITHAGLYDWEMFVNEGPWMYKQGGIYYLMYSGNGANSPFYGLGYATADSPIGPFEKYAGNPILETDWYREFYGPGHHSLAPGPNGERLIFYHTKTDDNFGWDRRIRINELRSDESGNLFVYLYDEKDDEAETDDEFPGSSSEEEEDSEGCGC